MFVSSCWSISLYCISRSFSHLSMVIPSNVQSCRFESQGTLGRFADIFKRFPLSFGYGDQDHQDQGRLCGCGAHSHIFFQFVPIQESKNKQDLLNFLVQNRYQQLFLITGKQPEYFNSKNMKSKCHTQTKIPSSEKLLCIISINDNHYHREL